MARRVVQTLPQMFIEMAADEKSSKIPVAAYARVSTEKDEQEDSFERQVEHYTQLINAKPEWRLVRIYADPGISGTRAEKRPDFLKMIEDCRAGKIKKVLVKSISRFARNTVDSLTYIRELKELGISIYFESENIDTLTPGGEVLITILAAMAEQESRTISSNIKWAWQRRWQAGDTLINTGLMLGYIKTGTDEDGHDVYEINEEEAEIVRRIYREYLAGTSITRICRNLEADGIKTKLGRDRWSYHVVSSILSNEKYTGDALLGKTYKADVLSKNRQKNDGKKSPIYFVEDTHPAIIEKEMFRMVKKELERRREAKEDAVGSSRYTSKYPFSGHLICGNDGEKLRRHVRTMGTGEKVASWACSRKVTKGVGECDLPHIREDVLQRTYLAGIRKIVENGTEVSEVVKQGLSLTAENQNKERMEAIDDEIYEIQTKVLELHKAKQRMEIGDAEYREQLQEYTARLKALESEQLETQDTATKYAEIRLWLKTFEDTMQNGDILTAEDGSIMRSLVERIIVRKDGIEIIFKCGCGVEQEYVR